MLSDRYPRPPRSLVRDHSRFSRELRELRDRLDLEFGHEACAVAFHRALRNAEIGGDLFVELAAQHMAQYFAFTRRQFVKPSTQLVPVCALFPVTRVTCQGPLHSG